MKARAGFGMISGLLVLRCASTGPTTRDIEDLSTRVTTLRAENAALSERVERLERMSSTVSLTDDEAASREPVPVPRLEPPRVVLRGVGSGVVLQETTAAAAPEAAEENGADRRTKGKR